MRRAVEPKKTAVLLNHSWDPIELLRLGAVVEDPPEATRQDRRAIVSTGGLRAQMIGYCRDHKGNVVDAKLVVVEERHPHLGVPAESGSILLAPRVEAIDVEACDICRFRQPMETERCQAPV